jgi:tRNA(fMet)-specific endonuclease VapC
MKYLLDTCVVSDFARGHPGVLAQIRATPPAEIAVSTITEMEIAYGLRLNPKLSRRLKPVMDAFFGASYVMPYDQPAALATAGLRAALKISGQPIGAYDAMIAGIAVARELVLVTSNLDEFERIAELRLENWRDQ